ncbi:CHAP domain-containing protein [Nocardioides sp. cx-173]|uniref:CHAP domain-containing protein n=1 Tax=Nocardioides sp. cx-173 TaxID=2898796 RepID=UPI001E3F1081|nr:CHAP domain-containing protein [Nocardioides sp. cx-173]MCD4524505.1 CHAP domain-containing protein [Nocardioides sp. cx-173]UGB43010.1 CHAP domain-containing protein [Nocardioides sp. cx-173]
MTRTRRLRRAWALGALLALLAPLGAAPATADNDGDKDRLPAPSLTRYGAVEQRASAYLCTGYAACAEAGYPHAGYRAVAGQMFWRMYSGHNCTNYAAYRMVKSGLPNTRPWSGGGNASEWGLKMSKITDTTPVVGSVAWWRANAPGTGSSGHVAYVEQVVSSTEIVISEDSWGGDFHWRRLKKADGRWPSGFIHFNDKVLTNVARPAVTGTPKVGVPLAASAGTWKPAGSYHFQWYAHGVAIPGATATRFVPTARQLDRKISVKVTATRAGYPATTVGSNVIAAKVAPGDLQNPQPPVINGVPEVDQVLTATRGSWAPNPSATTVQWYAGPTPIAGATGWRLRLGQAQIDQPVTAVVTATAPGYVQKRVQAQPTPAILAGTMEFTRPFGVSGVTRAGRTLSVTPGTFSPADAAVSYSWRRDGVTIPGAVGSTYVLQPADVGARISAVVRLDRASYRSAAHEIRTPTRVFAPSSVGVRPTGAVGKAVVVVRVTAPGVDDLGGWATVRIGAKKVVGKLVDGRVRVVVRGLVPGWKKVRVRYGGQRFALPAAGADRVYVNRAW